MDNVSLGHIMALATAAHFSAASLVFVAAPVVVVVLAVLLGVQLVKRSALRRAETRRRHNREMAQLYVDYSEQAAFWTPIIIPDATQAQQLPRVSTGT
jgi:esterase/lipase